MACLIGSEEDELVGSVNKYCLDLLHSGDLLTHSPYGSLYGLQTATQFNPQHKGDSGLVGVVGGSEDYTGAPYFTGVSALKAGADLSHIFCVPAAAPVIKSYNPDLIVHPLLGTPDSISEFDKWVDRLTSIVVGPGLGRTQERLDEVKVLISSFRDRKKALLIDADGLFLLCKYPDLIRNYSPTLLTPNRREFKYLYKSATGEELTLEADLVKSIEQAANSLGNVTILCKGPVDIITNGKHTAIIETPGSIKRCGGQGDILAGVCGAFLSWYTARESAGVCEAGVAPVMAGIGGSILTRMVARDAGRKYGASLTTTSMVGELPRVVSTYFSILKRIIK
ncbi:ATP-dependent (S)-NAD(P)H-hydrate dehydratase [Oopsacas minuta]|uniref:ATP-dependent (S)-NAD(P)H-hydrate dehydratase n=1 Tax=Oopsacas minuta TaxID=111878 RepID=A0AAV7KFP5_9METZ|nr:ATP-dependent (S)-NAD(P)H-hydrate dehydratase [Oopsacas minuta]